LSNETLQEETQPGDADSLKLRIDSLDIEQVQPAPAKPLRAPSDQSNKDFKDEGPVEYYQLDEFKPE
jgi:hypothetical protein